MDKYMVLIVTKEEELQQINDFIEKTSAKADVMYQENQERKQDVERKSQDVLRYQGMQVILQNEAQTKKSSLKKSLIVGGIMTGLVVVLNLTGITSIDWAVLIPSSLLSLAVYSFNMKDVNEVKEKFTLESLTELIESEQDSIVQIRSKAKEVTEEMIGLRNSVSDKRVKSSILKEEISNLKSIRSSIVESIYEDLIEEHVVKNGMQDYSAKPIQKAKRRV